MVPVLLAKDPDSSNETLPLPLKYLLLAIQEDDEGGTDATVPVTVYSPAAGAQIDESALQ